VTPDREQLLDELGLCYVRAALNQLLADPQALQENADVSGQERRRRKGLKRGDHTPIPATEAT
jgi:hypothetical protein